MIIGNVIFKLRWRLFAKTSSNPNQNPNLKPDLKYHPVIGVVFSVVLLSLSSASYNHTFDTEIIVISSDFVLIKSTQIIIYLGYLDFNFLIHFKRATKTAETVLGRIN